jgi:hypothetical protein
MRGRWELTDKQWKFVERVLLRGAARMGAVVHGRIDLGYRLDP